jgi:hypothetical protein
MTVAVAALLAVLAHNFGFSILLEPWNPNLPVMVWVVFVLAVWSVCCADIALLPVVAVAGSFCVQTHVSYVAPVCGLGALAIVATILHQRTAPRTVRPFVVAVAAGVLVWVAPVVEQFTRKDGQRGNLAELWDYFLHPPEAAIGVRRGAELLLAHLDPWGLLAGQHNAEGALLPGAALLALWIASAFVTWRVAPVALQRLHLVLAVALVSELAAMSRIFGDVFDYLMLWSLAITALIVFAVGWALALGVGPALDNPRYLQAATASLAVVTLVFAGWFAFDSRDAEMPLDHLGKGIGGVLPSTEAALRVFERDGKHKPFLVTWSDPIALGARGVAFVNELERAGFNVGASALNRTAVTDHRVVEPAEAAGQVHLSVGADIAAWRRKPGVREVARFDPRTPAERAESNRLRAGIARDLRARGLSRLMATIDTGVYAAYVDPRMPPAARRKLRRFADLDLPAAVFLAPPDTS